MDDWVFTEQNARQKLLKHFGTKSLKGFGVEHLKAGIIASGAIMQYLELTQHTSINHITSLKRLEEEKYVRLDKFTIRSLELLQPMQEDGLSLLDVIDRTTTPMGGRMLRRWMVFPLKEVSRINERLDIVEYFFKHPDFRQLIDEQLHRIGDLERIISKVAVGRVSPREVVQLKNALMAVQPIKGACQTADNDCLRRLGEQLNLCESLRDRMVLLNNMNNKKVANLNREAVNKRMYETNSAFDITTSLASTAVMGSSNETKDYVIERTSKTDTDMGNNLYFYFWKARDAYYACTIKSIALYFTNGELSPEETQTIIANHMEDFLYINKVETAIGENGITKDHSLRTIETTVPCTLYAQIMHVDEALAQVLEPALGLIKHMGMERNRGLGRCQFTIEKGGKK